MVSITKHLAELKLGSLGCLTTQLITCLVLMTVVHSMLPSHCPELAVKHGKDSRILQIQEELKSYRVHLETEAELLKKINNYQRLNLCNFRFFVRSVCSVDMCVCVCVLCVCVCVCVFVVIESRRITMPL